ncbi:MAG: sensor domain-containing diguanylate cyclase [Oryzomonas sp.]
MKGLGIQKRFALTFSVFLMIVFALILWGFLSYSMRLTRDSIQKQQFAMTELIARSIDDKLGTYLATITQVSNVVAAGHFTDPGKAQAFLDEHRDLISIFDNGIFLFDAQYNLVAETPYIKGRRGIKAAAVPFLESVRKNNFPDISNPYLSTKTHTPAIAMAAPVSDHSGRFLGFLAGSINLSGDYFAQEIMGYKIGSKGYLYLFTTDRTMILHPDKSRIMKQDTPPGVNRFFDRAVQGFEGSGETVNTRGIPQIVSFKRLKIVDWILASAYPQEEAYAQIRRLRSFLTAAAALTTLLSILLVWLLTRRITVNLTSFSDQVRHIREHPEERHQIRIDSSDEVGLLADVFNGLMHEVKLNRERLEDLTRTDHLTGLFNRRHLEMEAPTLLNLAKRQNASSAVLLVDVDRFKRINDSRGHDAGDAVLVRLGKVLQHAVRPYDLMVRYGGEEFLVLLPLSKPLEALEVAERIRRTVQETPVYVDGEELSITVSIGVYAGAPIQDLLDAIARADEALYEAKRNGRNRVCLAPAAVDDTGVEAEMPPTTAIGGA